MTLIRHYLTLWHYLRHRYEEGQYEAMRTYFAELAVDDLRRDLGLSLTNRQVLEVGGDTGAFSAYFSDACKARCVNVEIQDISGLPERFANTVTGDGTMLPIRSETFDLVLCRGVIEHVPQGRQEVLVQECYRALKRGGYCLINTQPWYSPFAGHQLRPFHALPFPMAKRLANVFKGTQIQARSLEQLDPPLYPLTMKRIGCMIDRSGFRLVGTKDYHLRVHLVTRIPWLREMLTQSVSYLLRK